MTKKIVKLTEQQRARMPEWVEKWTRIGLSCEPADREKAERGIRDCYRLCGIAEPRRIVWVDSPIVCVVCGPIVEQVLCGKGDPLGVRAGVSDGVYAGVDDGVRDGVSAWKVVGWDSYFGGNLWAWWQSYQSFFREVCGLKLPHDLEAKAAAYQAVEEESGFWWPGTHVVYATDRPRQLNVWKDTRGVNRLHKDGGPSVEWRDGWALYHLHGVAVPPWLATERAEAIDPRRLKDIDNAQVRAEFVRKVGADRICHTIGKIAHESGGYALMDLEVIPGSTRKYLRMNNPSVPGVVHFEAVHPECATVEHAINWRRYGSTDKSWKPEVLT